MTPEQALSLLFQASRMAPLTWPDHDKILEAGKTLEQFITSHTTEWDKSKSE